MIVRKFSEAKAYEAPNHRDYKSFRVCSAPRWAARRRWSFGISHFLPGGGAGPDASPPEKIYYVLAGELTVIAGGKETVPRQATASTSARTKAARSSTAATRSAPSRSRSRR